MQKMPPGLGKAGRKMWREMTSDVTFRVDELVFLSSACRMEDQLAEYEEAVKDAPLTVAGAYGQEIIHPIRVEIRTLRMSQARILARIPLPEGDDDDDIEEERPMSRQDSARKAAKTRWSNR